MITTKNQNTDSPNISKRAFWDIDYDAIDWDINSRYLIIKVLQHGSFDDVLELINFYGTERIKKELLKADSLAETIYFFALTYFDLKTSDFKCSITRLNRESEEFIEPINEIDGIRLASLEDIAAMKINAIEDRKQKKDFIDLYELLKDFSFSQMIGFYKKRFAYNDEKSTIFALSQIDKADNSNMPKMLNNLSWEEVKINFKSRYREFIEEQVEMKSVSNKVKDVLKGNDKDTGKESNIKKSI